MKQTAKLAALSALLLAPVAARAQDPRLAPNAPADRPVDAATREAVERMDRAMQPYVDSARATYPAAKARYLAGLPAGQSFFAVTRLHDAAGHEEQVFVAVGRIENGRIFGRIYSRISVVSGFRYG
ncbi:hypothetical protein [Longimicrobium sp.]|uniref:hypothetical protein n=1 Tax=Longimicrobium sp. TaxID=2029185 RepID=UPI002B63BE35|nr:hypothetical protein [Longimicrobium sp.]HSU14611.1 hypothetical protein [Longimicrobium sp.]